MSAASFSEQIAPLIQLQEVDQELEQREQELAVWPEKISTSEQQLDELTTHRDALDTRRTELQVEYDRLQLEAKEERDRILQYERHAKEIKTNREYQAIMRETGIAKKAQADAEAAAAEVGEQLAEVEQDLAAAQERMDAVEAELGELREQHASAVKAFEADTVTLRKERKTLVGDVSRDMLNRYKLVRRRMPNVVVTAEDGSCTGCNRRLPPQLFNQVLRDDHMVTCPQCHRILIPRTEHNQDEAAGDDTAKSA